MSEITQPGHTTSEKIMQVDEVTITIEKTAPPTLVIACTGTVSSGGWSQGKLVPFVYVVPPPDGIWEFDFEATPPSGFAIDVLLPIAAEPFRWEDYPVELKGVKVYAQTNEMTQYL